MWSTGWTLSYQMLGVMCHVSGVTCHVSGVRCPVSGVTCHAFNVFFKNLFYKAFELVGGGSVINVVYPA